ncbi:MAG: hypothetical protein EVA83_01550 [Hyphomicrobiales bacterium]|nr:hypothetical protein [Rhodobiaceae bacterium]OUT81259.1 MAG: hypothetical protein CBB88_07605 [Rhizobiales bacterium TMED28]RZO34003.1 MAG: hypothetical protein EVA83_01550 [Hyphomicrobiales bacterium]
MTKTYKSLSYLITVAVLFFLVSNPANANLVDSNFIFFENKKHFELSNISYHGMASGSKNRSKKNKSKREMRALKHSLKNVPYQECILEMLIENGNDRDASLLLVDRALNGNKIGLRKILKENYQSCNSYK